MFHPWGKLRTLAHITVIWTRPHSSAPATTDGVSRIWLDPTLNQAERRCALTHELFHLRHQHRGCQPSAVERSVRVLTARALIPIDALEAQLRWSQYPAEIAEELWVTEQVLLDRLQHLSTAERHRLRQLD